MLQTLIFVQHKIPCKLKATVLTDLLQRRLSEFESEGSVGIEMPKIEAKRGDFAQIWQKLGASTHGSAAHVLVFYSFFFDPFISFQNFYF